VKIPQARLKFKKTSEPPEEILNFAKVEESKTEPGAPVTVPDHECGR